VTPVRGDSCADLRGHTLVPPEEGKVPVRRGRRDNLEAPRVLMRSERGEEVAAVRLGELPPGVAEEPRPARREALGVAISRCQERLAVPLRERVPFVQVRHERGPEP